MTRFNHQECNESLGAYVLKSLSASEAEAVEWHLESCESCRADLGDLRSVVDVLPTIVPEMEPSPELRERVMSVVRSEEALLRSAGPEADLPPHSAPRRRSLFGSLGMRPALAGALAATLLAVGLGGGVLLSGDGGSGPSSQTVAARITDPTLASSATASLKLTGDHAALVVEGMPEPERGRVYQVWVQRGSTPPEPAGATFALRSGQVEIPGGMRGVQRVLVTSEPSGGSREPTRTPVIVARPVVS